MASFKQIPNILLECLDDDVIDEEEFFLLYDLNRSKNPEFPHENKERFDLESMDVAECKAEFLFEKGDLTSLTEALQIPDVFKCDQRSVCDGMDGLCMLLRRFAYPCRYSDMIARFGRPVPVISMITNKVMNFIYDAHHHRLTNSDPTLLGPLSLQQDTDAISRNGAALDNCFGFIDGTVQPICRPEEYQRLLYNGRVHALKFQSLTLPNGMIGHMFGPVEGKMHDVAMLMVSGLLHDLSCWTASLHLRRSSLSLESPPPDAFPECKAYISNGTI